MWCNQVAQDVWDIRVQFESGTFDRKLKKVYVMVGSRCFFSYIYDVDPIKESKFFDIMDIN